MNKDKKGFNIKIFVSKVSQLVVAIGGMATVNSCTLFFHEKTVASELLNNHPFLSKE